MKIQDTQLHILVEKSLLDELTEVAKEEQRSRSSIIRVLIKEALMYRKIRK